MARVNAITTEFAQEFFNLKDLVNELRGVLRFSLQGPTKIATSCIRAIRRLEKEPQVNV